MNSPAEGAAPTKASLLLTAALWLAQILLACMFGFAGVLKATRPIADLARMLPWTQAVPLPLVRFIGCAEMAGAIGLILPALTRIQPTLTPFAALSLALVMLLATGFHVSRGETYALPITLSLGALAAFVAWGRLTRAPIPPRR